MRMLLASLMLIAVVSTASAGHNDHDSDNSRTQFSLIYTSDGGDSALAVRHNNDVCSSHRKSNCGACGRLVTYTERYWQAGYYKTVCVEPVYAWRRDSCGRSVRVLVREGYNRRVWVDGCWQTRQVTKWVPNRSGHHDDRRDRYSDHDRRGDGHRDRYADNDHRGDRQRGDRQYYGEYRGGGGYYR